MLREDLVVRVDTLKLELERSKLDKKAKKQQIQNWMDDFQRTYRREPAKDDKERVRPM
jgi:hypothetical protein